MYLHEVNEFIFRNGNVIHCLSDSVITFIECKDRNQYVISSNRITVYGEVLRFNRMTGLVKIYREYCGEAVLIASIPYSEITSVAIKNKSTIEKIC